MTALPPPRLRRLIPAVFAAVLLAGVAADVTAQVVTPPTGRRVRAYVSPDELVSFLPSTPFNEFVQLVNPIFIRVTGKRVVDPMDRTEPIGVSLNGVHFVDAFELALDRAGLDFRETEGYFIVEEAETPPTSEALAVGEVVPVTTTGPTVAGDVPATAATREVRIDAIIFEVNNSRFREVGTNWPTLFTEGGGGSGGGGGEEGGGGLPRFFLNAESFFDAVEGFLTASTDQIELGTLLRLFRYFETLGIGETIASPSVTVQSGEGGRIQSGSDIPLNIQDFQGNTVTQFVSTGIIIDVTPTLISDQTDAEGAPVEFAHLDVKVEKSVARPSFTGLAIDKSDVNTQVLLLDGEQTVIGGLYSTEESVSRRGIPVLKDIPLLNFFFSYKQRNVVQKELVVVLQVQFVDPVRDRAGRSAPANLYQDERDRLRERLDQFRPGQGQRYELITPDDREREEAGLGDGPARDTAPGEGER